MRQIIKCLHDSPLNGVSVTRRNLGYSITFKSWKIYSMEKYWNNSLSFPCVAMMNMTLNWVSLHFAVAFVCYYIGAHLAVFLTRIKCSYICLQALRKTLVFTIRWRGVYDLDISYRRSIVWERGKWIIYFLFLSFLSFLIVSSLKPCPIHCLPFSAGHPYQPVQNWSLRPQVLL